MNPPDKDSLEPRISQLHERRRAAQMTAEDEIKLVNTILDSRPLNDPLCIRLAAMMTEYKAAQTDEEFEVWYERWIDLLVECRRAIQ